MLKRAALIAVTVLTWSSSALSASPDDRALAEKLFGDARTILDSPSATAAEVARACRKLEESQRLDPAAGTLLNLATCHEREGKVASAWAEFRESASIATQQNRQDRLKFAEERVAAIKAEVPYIVIKVERPIPGLQVSRNATVIGEASWGDELPTDPGELVVEARAPGYKPWKKVFRLEKAQRLTVAVPSLERQPAAPAAKSSSPTALQRHPEPPPWTNLQITGLVIGGVGIVALGVGSYFGVDALGQKSKVDSGCSKVDGSLRCDSAGQAANDRAHDSATGFNIAAGAGTGALALGAALVLFGGTGTAERPQALHWRIGPTADGAFATVKGSF